MGLGDWFGKGAARAGVVEVNNMSKIIEDLLKQGATPGQISKILAGAGVVGGGAAAAATGLGSKLAGGVGQLGTALASELVASKLVGGQPYVPAQPETAGKGFLTTTQDQLAVLQYVARENFNRAILNRFGAGLEPLDADEELSKASQRKFEETSGATQRRIQEISAQRGFDVQIAELQRQAEIAKQQIASEAQVAAERERSLGDVQRQRVESSYASATNLLNQVIKDVVARERYDNNTSLAELSRAV